MENYEYEEMEMPTPCTVCGAIFDLNDGRASEKWLPNTTICQGCHDKEAEEIEEDEQFEESNYELSNALYIFKDRKAWDRLTDDNRKVLEQYILSLIPSENQLTNEASEVTRAIKYPQNMVHIRLRKNFVAGAKFIIGKLISTNNALPR